MKDIKLTEKQKFKLLKMCNKLFSEEGKGFKVLDGSIYYSEDGNFPGWSVHWFQFCMTELSEKIFFRQPYNPMNKEYYLDFCWECNLYWDGRNSRKTEHPVDYLYKKFNELKIK